MSEIARLGLILMLVTLVAAIALGFVNGRTAPIIAEQKRLAREEAMGFVTATLGDSLRFDSMAVDGLANPYGTLDRELAVVRVHDAVTGNELGYAFIAYGKGYSSTIQTMVGTDLSGTIVGSSVLYQQETPGLGANAESESWIGQFRGMRAPQCLVDKDGGEIDSITGATITSRTIASSVRVGLEAMAAAGLFSEGGGGN